MKPMVVDNKSDDIPAIFSRFRTYFDFLDREDRLSLLALFIGVLQCMMRIGAIGEYGFHQDELLYVALSEHLALGYNETPPFIAFIGRISMLLFGDSLVAFRTIPCCCAVAIVYFTGKITIKLNGGIFAVIVACSAIAFSSAFLATGAMFIPQVFDELCWVLLAYVLIIWLKEKNDNFLLLAGLIVGLGLYIKYTVVLYALGLLTGLAFSYPSIWKRKKLWYAILVAIIIFIPHVCWQVNHGFPALQHYQELKETQLIYLTKIDFVVQQLAVNGMGIIVWIIGIFAVSKYRELKAYRFLGFAFVFTMTALLLLNGKSYYAFGAFPPLFALGAVYLEVRFKTVRPAFKAIFVSILLVPNLLLAIIVLPHLPIEKAAKVFEWTYRNLNMHYPLKWEDQKIHNMNQNYADMIGWDELAAKTAKIYHSLPNTERDQTVVFAYKYGEAGAIDYYQKTYQLPQVISFSSSYALWAPIKFNYRNIILITDSLDKATVKGCKIIKYDEVKNVYSRIQGMDIYLVKDINSNFRSWYLNNRLKINERRTSFIRKITTTLE